MRYWILGKKKKRNKSGWCWTRKKGRPGETPLYAGKGQLQCLKETEFSEEQ